METTKDSSISPEDKNWQWTQLLGGNIRSTGMLAVVTAMTRTIRFAGTTDPYGQLNSDWEL